MASSDKRKYEQHDAIRQFGLYKRFASYNKIERDNYKFEPKPISKLSKHLLKLNNVILTNETRHETYIEKAIIEHIRANALNTERYIIFVSHTSEHATQLFAAIQRAGPELSVELIRPQDFIYCLRPFIITTYHKLADMICTGKINSARSVCVFLYPEYIAYAVSIRTQLQEIKKHNQEIFRRGSYIGLKVDENSHMRQYITGPTKTCGDSASSNINIITMDAINAFFNIKEYDGMAMPTLLRFIYSTNTSRSKAIVFFSDAKLVQLTY